MFRSIGYDPATATLEVEYNNGQIERRTGVSMEAYQGMMASDSIGKYFHAHIKKHSTIVTA